MNKKTKIAIVGIIALVLVTIGITYAYWLVTRTQEGENVITTGCLDITLEGENDITLTEQFPISDEDGMKLVPYTFTVTNNCNTSVDYQINLESIGDSSNAISADALKAVLDENTPKLLYDYVGASTTVEGAYEAYTLGYGTLSAKDMEGSAVTYKLRIWIDEDSPISEMNKTYTSKISVSVGQGVSAEGSTLATQITSLYGTNDYVQTLEDDLGTSYFLTENFNNNYVKFGTYAEDKIIFSASNEFAEYSQYVTLDACESAAGVEYPPEESGEGVECKEVKLYSANMPIYWRILRINGDGTARLIYDGPEALNDYSGKRITIQTTIFNANDMDVKYLGYTYEDENGIQVDSTIKKLVDEWYKINLETSYGKYIADGIFCNDRESYKKSNYSSLKCPQNSDKYTVSSNRGNGLLSMPVGLKTSSETFFGKNSLTSSWTMTPSGYDEGLGAMMNIDAIGVSSTYVSDKYNGTNIGARPVINIKADVLFTGKGTIDSPYEIVTE